MQQFLITIMIIKSQYAMHQRGGSIHKAEKEQKEARWFKSKEEMWMMVADREKWKTSIKAL